MMCELDPYKSLGTSIKQTPHDLKTTGLIGKHSGLVDSVWESLISMMCELESSKSLGIGKNPGEVQPVIPNYFTKCKAEPQMT